MRKLTGSLNSDADVECLGTGHLLEGVCWCKWGGGHTFLCTQKWGLHKILQLFLRGHVCLYIPISFLNEENNTFKFERHVLGKVAETCLLNLKVLFSSLRLPQNCCFYVLLNFLSTKKKQH